MFSFIQVLIFSLIILSFLIINTVPVILATPGEWEKSQSLVWRGLFFWSFLVMLIGILTLVSK